MFFQVVPERFDYQRPFPEDTPRPSSTPDPEALSISSVDRNIDTFPTDSNVDDDLDALLRDADADALLMLLLLMQY